MAPLNARTIPSIHELPVCKMAITIAGCSTLLGLTINSSANLTHYLSRQNLILSSFKLSDDNFVSFLSPVFACCIPFQYNCLHYISAIVFAEPVPMAAWSKTWVCGRSFAGIVGSNSGGLYGCLSVVSVVCCKVEVSATG